MPSINDIVKCIFISSESPYSVSTPNIFWAVGIQALVQRFDAFTGNVYSHNSAYMQHAISLKRVW